MDKPLSPWVKNSGRRKAPLAGTPMFGLAGDEAGVTMALAKLIGVTYVPAGGRVYLSHL